MCSRETLKPRLCGRERALLLPTRCGTSGPTYRGEAYVKRQKKGARGTGHRNWGKVPNFPACAFTLMPPPVTPPHTHAAPPPQLALSMLSLFSVKRVGICQNSRCIIPFFINSHMWWMQKKKNTKRMFSDAFSFIQCTALKTTRALVSICGVAAWNARSNI